MGTKLVENVNDEIWRRFVGYSKMQGKNVGPMLSDVLGELLENVNRTDKNSK